MTNQVQVIDFADETVLMCGGAAAAMCNAAAAAHLGIDHNGVDFPIVIIHPEIRARLSEYELSGMIAHELGHHSCGHIEMANNGQAVTVNGIIDNSAWEFEADAAAAASVGPDAVASGLEAICREILERDMLNSTFARMGVTGTAMDAAMAAMRVAFEQQLQPRIAALRAMQA